MFHFESHYISAQHLKVWVRGETPIIDGETFVEMKIEESTWLLEDKKIVLVTVEKVGIWWLCSDLSFCFSTIVTIIYNSVFSLFLISAWVFANTVKLSLLKRNDVKKQLQTPFIIVDSKADSKLSSLLRQKTFLKVRDGKSDTLSLFLILPF